MLVNCPFFQVFNCIEPIEKEFPNIHIDFPRPKISEKISTDKKDCAAMKNVIVYSSLCLSLHFFTIQIVAELYFILILRKLLYGRQHIFYRK